LIEVVFPQADEPLRDSVRCGQALALMDKAALVVALSRYGRRMVVTASSETDCHVPDRQGQLVELAATVVARRWRASSGPGPHERSDQRVDVWNGWGTW
jgi:acyl-CoA hydrolase